MNHQLIIAFLLGFAFGGGLIAWLSWAYLHARLVEVEQSLHDRFSAFEARIAAQFHFGKSAPASPAPTVPAPAVPAAQAAPAQQN